MYLYCIINLNHTNILTKIPNYNGEQILLIIILVGASNNIKLSESQIRSVTG